MTNYREKLKELQGKSRRKQHLESLLIDLEQQQKELKERISRLEQVKQAEQADVDKLEGRSLAAFFYGLLGTKEERLDKERQEARAAGVKYDLALRELEVLRKDMVKSREELIGLVEVLEHRRWIRAGWIQAVKDEGGPAAEEILRLDEQLVAAQEQQREIQEAQEVGQRALAQVEAVMGSLKEADGWGTWDVLGGGLISTMLKHDAIDEAQRRMEDLQVELRQFKTELMDVKISEELRLTLDGFTQFADYFFDGFFVDWLVLDQIREAQARVRTTGDQIQGVLDRLAALRKEREEEAERLQNQVEGLLLSL